MTAQPGDATLSDEARRRYARHVLLPEVGARGQMALITASLAVAGDGAAAEEAATYLAAAGVGRLVVDPALADRLAARIADLNPDVRLVHASSDAALTGLASVAPRHPERRADGAEAALCALLRLLGLGARDHLEGMPDP